MGLLKSLRFIAEHPLNRHQPLRALYGFVKWQVGIRLVPGKVVYPWIGGSRFLVGRGESGLTGNVYCGLHEFAEMAYVLHVLGPDDCFVDVGANVGSYTILACAVRGAIGHCFEPVPATFQRLRDNLDLNGLNGRVTAHNCGLGEGNAELRFTTNENCTNHVVGTDERSEESALVKVVPMDSALASVSPSLIKIDVEGFETSVLRGAQSTLSNPSLHSVIMEVNGSGLRYGYADSALVETMSRHGFRECRYLPFERRLTEAAQGNPRSGNAIFARDMERIQRRIAKAPRFVIHGREL